jgi:hypothetical protein
MQKNKTSSTSSSSNKDVARSAQMALGIHAGLVLVCMTCCSIILSIIIWDHDGGEVAGGTTLLLLAFSCMGFAAFLAAMPWWMTTTSLSWGNNNKPPARLLFMVWTLVSCVFICMLLVLCKKNAYPIDYIAQRFLVWSALFLIEQTLLSHPACKVVYGVLLTGFLLFITHDLVREPHLVIGYILAVLWCWWVIYDSQYHANLHDSTGNVIDDALNDNNNGLNDVGDMNDVVFKLSLIVVCDITRAGFAACMYYPNKMNKYHYDNHTTAEEQVKMLESRDCLKDMDVHA